MFYSLSYQSPAIRGQECTISDLRPSICTQRRLLPQIRPFQPAQKYRYSTISYDSWNCRSKVFLYLLVSVRSPKIKNRRQMTANVDLRSNSSVSLRPRNSALHTGLLLRVFYAMPQTRQRHHRGWAAAPTLNSMTCGAMDFARVFFAGIVVESAAAPASSTVLLVSAMTVAGKMNDAAAAERCFGTRADGCYGLISNVLLRV